MASYCPVCGRDVSECWHPYEAQQMSPDQAAALTEAEAEGRQLQVVKDFLASVPDE